MKYDLTSPCVNCPFRSDVTGFLTVPRAREIIDAITKRQQAFTCHKTVDYDSMEDDDFYLGGPIDQHCSGALIFLEKLGQPNQMMRIAERLGMYDRRKLRMDAPVFNSAREMVDHMRKPRAA